MTWMPACSLGQQKNTADNKDRDDKRGERTAERKTAVADRLVQKVPNGGAEWPRQDESRPEQRYARDIRPEVKRDHHSEGCPKNKRATFVAEASGIGDPVAQGRAKRLREGDGSPIECLYPRIGHGIHRDGPL